VGDHEVLFRWDVTPPTELYRRSDFRLSFPPDLDLTTVPSGLWWRLAMFCLHTHWALLRPCRVELPIRLGPGERTFWLRLVEAAAVNLVEYGSTPRPGRPFDLVETGPALRPALLETDGERMAAAFSGGKDSLTQSGLLAELSDRPLLVTTTSPVEWANDHAGAARERAMTEIVRRLPVELVEVRSDFRSCWSNGFAALDGATITVNELTDVLLYQVATVAAAAATGIGRSFLASEADLQYNANCTGGVLQHAHFASSAVTMTSLSGLLGPFGLSLGSLTYPLHTPQVQGLLWRRYPELTDLQFSCWLAAAGAQACGTCHQCFEIGMVVLAEGRSPSRVGIDPVRMVCSRAAWQPDQISPGTRRPLHPTRSGRDHVLRSLRATAPEQVAQILDADPACRGHSELGQALDVYARLHAAASELDIPPAPGYVGGFLELIDPDLREPLRAIVEQYFEAAPKREFAGTVGRSRALTARIAEPLGRAQPGALRVLFDRLPAPRRRQGGELDRGRVHGPEPDLAP
jgi:hypothetical protein